VQLFCLILQPLEALKTNLIVPLIIGADVNSQDKIYKHRGPENIKKRFLLSAACSIFGQHWGINLG
jgi:hypothetical protein